MEIIPHTAIIAWGKEYFFGQGIELNCTPHEFRASRGIQPIEIQTLGHTTCTQQEFENWCRSMHNGEFSPTSYDLITRNCNNFSDAAAKSLRLPKAVPQWILDLPQKFMSSPLGMMLRPMLEEMQMTTVAPTNIGNNGSMRGIVPQQQPASTPTAAANPWANIPSTTATTTQPTKSKGTPLLDKQTALLSTDVGVVKICIDKLKPDEEQTKLLSKLADINAQWTGTEISSVHKYLQSVIANNAQFISYALMLLRLVVLKGEDVAAATESTKLVASLIMDGKLKSSTYPMAWCVLSNAMGSNNPPKLDLAPIIDQALSDCDCSKDKALRQSSAAFLYNVSTKEASSDGELSEAEMSILLGALENLQEETDAETAKRLYMATGQLLKSNASAVSLVNELGLMDGEIARGKMKEVESLASEVASLCS